MGFFEYLTAGLVITWVCVGALVVMTFVLDTLIAAARATSQVLLELAANKRFAIPIKNPWWGWLSYWRERLFRFYGHRRKRVTIEITYKDATLAIWRGVFRWEFIDPWEDVDQTPKLVGDRNGDRGES